MYKSFKKFIEGITHEENDNDLTTILEKLDKETIVRFALVCAEDAYQVNPNLLAKKCIDLVKQWLSSDEYLNDQLRVAAATAWGSPQHSVATAASAAWVVLSQNATAAAHEAALTALQASRAFDNERNIKIQEYIQLAKSLFSKSSIKSNDFLKGIKQDFDKDETRLGVMLDILTDENEDLVIMNQEGTFINYHGKNIKISDEKLDDNDQVMKAIMSSQRKNQIILYVRNLYKNL